MKITLKYKWKFLLLLFVLCCHFKTIECHIDLVDHSKFMNENSSFFHPTLISVTQTPLTSKNLTLYDAEELKLFPWWCTCAVLEEIEELAGELECHCEGTKLFQIPQNLHNITRLSITNSKFKVLRESGLRRYSSTLKDIYLINLSDFYLIESEAFKNFRQLRAIYISHAPRLQYVTAETFRYVSQSFKILRIIHSGLREVPDLRFLRNIGILLQLDFEGNQISEILENSIQIRTEQLIIDNNVLVSIARAAFNGSQIGKLSLKGNTKLRQLHERAFEGLTSIQELDLSSTSLTSLPSVGLNELEILRIQNTPSLKHIPSVYDFQNLEKAWLTHSFHCCAFKFPQQHDPNSYSKHLKLKKYECEQEYSSSNEPIFNFSNDLSHSKIDRRKRRSMNSNKTVEIIPITEVENNLAEEEYVDSISLGGTFHQPTIILNHDIEAMCGNISLKTKDVECFPKADALNPCEDVMGSSWLRASVWIVVSLAVIGNVSVLVVLLSNRSEFTVPKFLMCNLALADLSMGIYLMLIASIDLHSMGEYFNFAFDWQYGIGCKTAGWLTVFASHLSIYTLTIITIERWFAITHAIYLNKRLKHKTAMIIMIFGWIWSVLMAAMPLFGISNYSSTSICLPMEANDSADIIYLITVLALSGVGFFIVVICYAQIYFSLGKETRNGISGSGRSEMTVAKKMALLVFTNFACWAPIAFFGFLALAGFPLINVTKAKILLVFFYPLNSCANPYLYAILTSQYRRDLFLLLSKFGICKKRAQQYRMNYSNPTHTIPLNMLNSSIRNSNSMNFYYRRSTSSNNAKSNAEKLLDENNVVTQSNGKNDIIICDEC